MSDQFTPQENVPGPAAPGISTPTHSAPSHSAAAFDPHALDSADERAIDLAVEEAMAGVSDADLSAAADAAPSASESRPDSGILSGRIANIGSQDVLIDFGGKSLGAMPLTEFDADEKYAVGDAIEVMFVDEDPRGGLLIVSRRKARQTAMWRDMKVGMTMEGVVTGMNKGGLEVNIHGLRGFIPASQVDVHFMKDISELIGKTISADVVKFDAAAQDVVLSRRQVQMRDAAGKKEKAFADLALGQVRRGVVRGLTDYGAFVDLGGVDALLHITDMSWGRVNKAEDVLKVGDEIEAKIIKINKAEKKVSLSLKQTIADPWTNAAERYKVGDKVKGRVVRLQNFGAFVELEPGIDALLPVSELSWTRRIHNAAEVMKEGDIVDVGIIAFDAAKRRISLSLKAVTSDPWANVAEKYPVNQTVKGKVVRTTEFGAFVALEDGIDGLIHISELSDQRVKSVADKVKPGQEVEVRVIGVDPVAHKISLSMKPPPKAPTPEELAAIERERIALEKKREKQKTRRGGITIGWDVGLGGLDPSKFAR